MFTQPSHEHRIYMKKHFGLLWQMTICHKFVHGRFQHTRFRITNECASYRLTPKQVLSHTWRFAGFLLSVSAQTQKVKFKSPITYFLALCLLDLAGLLGGSDSDFSALVRFLFCSCGSASSTLSFFSYFFALLDGRMVFS